MALPVSFLSPSFSRLLRPTRPRAAALLLLAAALTGVGIVPVRAQDGQPVSHGNFADSSGAHHIWRINTAHTLIWDEHPFVPVGGLFQVKSWSRVPTEEAWQSDVAALQALKSKGISDIYVQPARGGLTTVPPAAIQRLLNMLDEMGFTYGISINDGPTDILTGYVVRPGAYRQVAPETGGTMDFPLDNLASSLYFLVGTTGGEIVKSGEATPTSSGAQVTIDSIPGKFVVFLVPRKVYLNQPIEKGGIGLPNLWDGFDTYRDNLLTLFRQVKPGKGFRFFVDALPSDLTVTGGEVEHMIPAGTGFYSEWEDWLTRKYKNIDALQNAWGITNRGVKDFTDASHLIPLWGGGKGVEAFENLSDGKQLVANTGRSNFWGDLNFFKAQSVRGYMNDLATVLKRNVADVPVVYRSRGYSPLFADLPPTSGFDGVGIESYGRGSQLVTGSAGYVYAQAAEALKTLWLPVVSTADMDPAHKTSKGYVSATALHSDLDWLREIGARGFYVNGVRLTDPQKSASDLSTLPGQIDWLADYTKMLIATGVASSDEPPKAVFYPRAMTLASLRPLAGGIWWLPTDRPGVVYDFGPAGSAYSLSEDGNVVYYLFSPSGTRRVRLKVPKASRLPEAPPIRWSVSARGELNHNKDILTLTIGPDPVRIENLNSLPVPMEAFDELYDETQELTGAVRASKNIAAGRYETELAGIKGRYKEDQPYPAIADLLALRTQLRQEIRQYAWIEAEGDDFHPVQHTFDEIADRPGASGGRVLLVDPRPAGSPEPVATYSLLARANAAFQVWVAASPGAKLSFWLNGHPMLDQATLPKQVGEPFAGGKLVWTSYGVATIPRGNHKIEMRASGPAVVDVILLTREPFTPDGANPPPVHP